MAHTSMVKVVDNKPKRVFLVSWRPTKGDEKMSSWVARLKQRIRLECGAPTIIDPLQPGKDKASERESECTDFVSLVTVEYAVACEEEDDHELLKRLPALRDGVSPVCFWALNLDPGEPRQWLIRNGTVAPWEAGYRWHFLPNTGDYFDVEANDMDMKMARQCIVPLKKHEPDCIVCHQSTQD